jgi:hypothetical protein
MARYCRSCGTEVDETAVFCPTCGQPIDDDAPVEMPAAPTWPEPVEGGSDRDQRSAAADASPRPDDLASATAGHAEEDDPAGAPTRIEERPVPDEPAAAPERRPESDQRAEPGPRPATLPPARGRSGPQIDLPITAPVTLSGWLVGIGSVLAVLGLIVVLVTTVLNVIDLLLLLALVSVAATVFFSATLPAVPHVRLITLVVVLIAFGVALDRIGFRAGGVGELLLFIGSAAAAMGSIILELGKDQPLGGSRR